MITEKDLKELGFAHYNHMISGWCITKKKSGIYADFHGKDTNTMRVYALKEEYVKRDTSKYAMYYIFWIPIKIKIYENETKYRTDRRIGTFDVSDWNKQQLEKFINSFAL